MKLKNGRVIDIEPPKMKILKKIASLSEIKDNNDLTEEDISKLTEAVALAFNKNRQNYKITAEKVEDEYDILEIVDFLDNYFNWINSIQNQKN
jgi:hypothetical protein